MSDEHINNAGAANAGSPANNEGNQATQAAASAQAGNQGGKSEINLDDYISKKDYEELQKKLGENSAELGGLRNFFTEVHPLLEKLQDQPDVIQAIIDGKIDSSLAQAVLEGKVKIGDAKDVAEAHAQVKEDLGKDKYDKLGPDEIKKLVTDRLEESMKPVIDKLMKSEQHFNKALTDAEERREYTPDYQDFAADIDKWFDEHPNQFDIEVAYYAVKGKQTTAEARKKAEEVAAEEAKKLAANAGGGQSRGNASVNDPDLVDKLFGDIRNPNSI